MLAIAPVSQMTKNQLDATPGGRSSLSAAEI
jgi:hypothetical protein